MNYQKFKHHETTHLTCILNVPYKYFRPFDTLTRTEILDPDTLKLVIIYNADTADWQRGKCDMLKQWKIHFILYAISNQFQDTRVVFSDL